MNPRNLGVAILFHATLFGVALHQVERGETVQPQAAMSVATSRTPSAPFEISSPALKGAWPVPELELPGVVPAPDREIIPEPKPEPVFEPNPEFMETVEPTRREPVIKPDWKPHEETAEAVDAPNEKVSQASDQGVRTPGKEGAHQRSGAIEGFPSPDTPPRILNPDWPRTVRERYTGSVEVKVVVGTDGRALRVELVKGTSNEAWNDRLLRTFKEADYAPGVHHGTVLVTSHVFRVHFKRTR